MANQQILTDCIAYLDACVVRFEIAANERGRKLSSHSLEQCRFLEYVVYNWAYHCSNINHRIQGDYTDVASKFSWSDRWLYWIEFWFAFKAQNLWRLSQYFVMIRNWSYGWMSHNGNGHSLLTSVSDWAEHVLHLLKAYGSPLEDQPSSVHFIDSNLCLQNLGTVCPYEPGFPPHPSFRTQHIRLQFKSFEARDGSTNNCYSITNHHLQPP